MPDSLNIQPPAAHHHAVKSIDFVASIHPAAGDTVITDVDSTYTALDTTAIAFAHEQAVLRGEVEIEEEETPPAPPAWTTGLEPVPRPVAAANDSGLVGLIVALLLLVTLSFRHCGHLFKALFKDLWSVRTRAKNFDEHTSNETQLMVLYGTQLTIYLGILLNAVSNVYHGTAIMADSFSETIKLIALAAGYYIFQLAAYSTVGYAFAEGERRHQWMRGFNASQTFLGFSLALPALVTVFYPAAAITMLQIAAGLYILARLVFIFKGFKIFYHKISSLVYFILYLCTLEVIPVIFILYCAINISNVF
jgi:hypothetical protein